MQPIENSAKLSQNPSKSVKFHLKIRTRLELSNFGGWRAASPTAFIRIFGYKAGLQPVLIHPTANLGDRTKMYVLFLNNHSKLFFSSLIYTAVYFATRKLYDSLEKILFRQDSTSIIWKYFLKVQSGCRFSCYIGSGAKEKGGTVPLKKLLGN